MEMEEPIPVSRHGRVAGVPYHVFGYHGVSFAVHAGLGRPLKISHEARVYLARRASGEDAPPACEGLRGEIAALEAVGFFAPCEPPIPTDAEFDRLLRRRYEAPWTKLELALSEVCNLACRYCYCGTCRDEVPNQGRMGEAVARAAINWLFAVSGRSKEVGITFFGGEPLMNKDVLLFAVSYSQRLAKLHGKKVFYSMTTNGTLYPCHRFVGMENWVVGSVADGPDVVKCQEFWRTYRELVRSHCFGCWAYPYCKGPCPWEVARADGTFALSERNCAETKRWIMQGAWFEDLYAKEMKGAKI